MEKSFRLQAKYMLLTWPQCETSKEHVLEGIKSTFKDLKGCVVAREEHEDGSPHIHAYVELYKNCDIKRMAVLDGIAGKHGNYKPYKAAEWSSPGKMRRYVEKEGDVVSFGEMVAAEEEEDRVKYKVLHSGNVLMEAVKFAKKESMTHATFGEVFWEMQKTEKFICSPSLRRLELQWLECAFTVMMRGKRVDMQQALSIFS